MHCLLFPSLHDSSGNVVLEALANGLPVICLDLGGPATLVTQETSIVVSTQDANETKVVERLASAIERLAGNEALRRRMADSALLFASSGMSWHARAKGAVAMLANANFPRQLVEDKQ